MATGSARRRFVRNDRSGGRMNGRISSRDSADSLHRAPAMNDAAATAAPRGARVR
jgi:hypothetical protein